MSWILLTILAALGQSIKDAISKKLASDIQPLVLSTLLSGFLTFVFFISMLFNWKTVSQLTPTFFLVFILTGVMFAVSQTLMAKSFAIADLSLMIPLLNFSPIFTLVLGIFFLGEIPNLAQILGIVLIIIGSYILRLNFKTKSFLEPFKHLKTDKASQMMLLVAFIWGLDTILSKIGARETNPYFWSFSTRLLTLIILLPLAISKYKKELIIVTKNYFWTFLAMAGFVGFSIIAQTIALLNMTASINSAILRFGTLFSVLIGIFLFKEKNLLERSIGAVFMIIGVVIISLK